MIDQRPKPGAKVPEGSRVTLVVSDGPAPILVPNFVGMTLEKAQARANALGITLDSSQHIAGNPPNTIASQSIAAGSKVDKNAILHVVVNGGLPANAATAAAEGPMADVPSVTGLPYNEAMQALTQAGFHPAVAYAQQSTGNGTIVSQDPSGGQAAPGNQRLRSLYRSRGRCPTPTE